MNNKLFGGDLQAKADLIMGVHCQACDSGVTIDSVAQTEITRVTFMAYTADADHVEQRLRAIGGSYAEESNGFGRRALHTTKMYDGCAHSVYATLHQGSRAYITFMRVARLEDDK